MRRRITNTPRADGKLSSHPRLASDVTAVTAATKSRKREPAYPSRQRASRLALMLTLLVTVDYADRGVLGAMAPTLKRVFDMDNTKYGVLSGVFGLVAAVATLPAGLLIDRVSRVRLLGGAAALWSVAMIFTAAAMGFLTLLFSRLFLAVVAAVVGPAFPSIAGDAVPAERRGAFLGEVESGQVLGAALGVIIGGAAVASGHFRLGFAVLAIPGFILGFRLFREREPERRETSHHLDDVKLAGAGKYLLKHRTAWLVLLAVTCANAYLAAVGAFAVIFAVGQYDVSSGVADLTLLALGVGALGGILAGSRMTDGLLAAGRPVARIRITAWLSLFTAFLWLPAILTHSLAIALPFLFAGSVTLAMTLPALDAVRIEVVPGAIRGKTEAFRTLLRTSVEGGIPLAVGFASDRLAGGGAAGLRISFLCVLPTLVLAFFFLLAAAPSYERDEAAARSAETAGVSA